MKIGVEFEHCRQSASTVRLLRIRDVCWHRWCLCCDLFPWERNKTNTAPAAVATAPFCCMLGKFAQI
jgi:hypothetical protein